MKKILIVDDDKDLLFSLGSYLSKKDYSILVLEQGRDVLDLARIFSPDVILLDIHLGDADGRDICHELKENSASNRIPVMMMSAEIDVPAIQKICLPDDLIEKPFIMNALLSKIQNLIKPNT